MQKETWFTDDWRKKEILQIQKQKPRSACLLSGLSVTGVTEESDPPPTCRSICRCSQRRVLCATLAELSTRTAYRCKLKGNNCIKRILGYLAQLRTFLLVFFGRHCDQSSDHDEGLRASTSTDTLLCFPVYRNIPNRRFAVLSECLMKTDAFCIQ